MNSSFGWSTRVVETTSHSCVHPQFNNPIERLRRHFENPSISSKQLQIIKYVVIRSCVVVLLTFITLVMRIGSCSTRCKRYAIENVFQLTHVQRRVSLLLVEREHNDDNIGGNIR